MRIIPPSLFIRAAIVEIRPPTLEQATSLTPRHCQLLMSWRKLDYCPRPRQNAKRHRVSDAKLRTSKNSDRVFFSPRSEPHVQVSSHVARPWQNFSAFAASCRISTTSSLCTGTHGYYAIPSFLFRVHFITMPFAA
jgi:hypothetical protein